MYNIVFMYKLAQRQKLLCGHSQMSTFTVKLEKKKQTETCVHVASYHHG